MRLRLIWVGKTKNEHARALVEDYVGRLSRFCRTEVTELREGSGADDRAVREEEARRIAGALTPGSLAVLLDIEGQQLSSHELAARLEGWLGGARKEIAFVVGGHLGVTEEIKSRADVRWSLSRLTLTHEMARVVAAEQLYRAFTIVRGLPYQK
ncbi:MAG: 23S rRNA (pseudouridine(1915)-N(3))-methyltransferase RlmH [Acidobacteria bacterium]|nr:23S rRNA (pseudouridine(1915)-N(3))-methyltransferase RlmH [Acidobacteriota bacterium]MCA1641265.1 23S rRNA (pseudouridine(1915)-N(3))-methyltransferase RlmH [Acidobacteriota bacterium]